MGKNNKTRGKVGRNTVSVAMPSSSSDEDDSTDMTEMVDHKFSKFLKFIWIADELKDKSIKDLVERSQAEDLQQLLDSSVEKAVEKEIGNHFLLHKAVEINSSRILQILLNSVCDDKIILLKNDEGKTALHCAVEDKKLECCRAIMQRCHSSLVEKDDSGDTPLHYIADAKHNFLGACQIAMEIAKKEQINVINKKHQTPVHIAAKDNCLSILQLFLNHEGQPRAKTKNKYTPLHFAADNGHNACLRILLQCFQGDTRLNYMDEQSSDGSTALMLAAKNGYSQCCAELRGANVNLSDKKKYTALHYAANKGSLSMVKYLIEQGADVTSKNDEGKTALHLAASCYNGDCLSYLLQQGGVEAPPEELLKIATLKNSYKCLDVILQHDENNINLINHQFKDDNNNTLLHYSLKKINYKITQRLLDIGARKDIHNDQGEYPLHLAAEQCKLESRAAEEERIEACNDILKRSHELICCENNNKETPLHLAAKSGNIIMVRSLIKKNSQLLAREKDSLTPIHLAAQSGHHECLRTLIRALNSTQMKELAAYKPHPLHLAAEAGRLDSCKVIVQDCKLKPFTAVNTSDMYPVDVAYKSKQYEIFRYLLEQMRYDENLDEFSCRLHRYCKKSIKDKNEPVFEAIIASEWCCVAFNSFYCRNFRCHFNDEPAACSSFANLIQAFPEAACNVMDRHITTSPNKAAEVHDFTPFECNVYNKAEDGHLEPAFSSTKPFGVEESARILKRTSWARDHPLLEASKGGHAAVLTHPLTRSWLHFKYVMYARIWLYASVMLDLVTALLATVMLFCLYNTNHLTAYFNGATTDEVCAVYDTLADSSNNITALLFSDVRSVAEADENCLLFNVTADDGDDAAGSAVWNRSACVIINLQGRVPGIITLQVLVAVILSILVTKEIYFLKKIHRVYRELFSLLRYLRLVTMFVIFWPTTSSCYAMLGLREVVLWQFGVVAVLLSWMNLVSSLNKIPSLTVFMPVTNDFIISYLKVIMPIVIIILSFALSFQSLLIDNAAFGNLGYSLIKTLVWMLGDLGYDDTFLDAEAPLKYPIMANILFVLFVTTIGGLAFNFILRDPTDQLDDIKQKASFYQAQASLEQHLLIDECMPGWKRQYARAKLEIPINNNDGKSNDTPIMYSRFTTVRGKNNAKKVTEAPSTNNVSKQEGCDAAEIKKEIMLLKKAIDQLTNKINMETSGTKETQKMATQVKLNQTQ